MTNKTCTHPACLLPDTITRDLVELREVEPIGQNINGGKLTPFTNLYVNGVLIGAVRDDGYQVHESHGGGWKHKWVGWLTGRPTALPEHTWMAGEGWVRTEDSQAATIAALLPEAELVAFRTRLALHPHSKS